MYLNNEIPSVGLALCYYDTTYESTLAEAVVQSLERNNLFPPERVNLSTGSKFKRYTDSMREDFIGAYSKKDLLAFSWESTDSRKNDNYLLGNWTLTFHKKTDLRVQPATKPWNVLHFFATYSWIASDKNRENLFRCGKELFQILRPFWANIDDVSHSVSLRKRQQRQSLLVPQHLHTPTVYWGNYWGPDVCARYDIAKLQSFSSTFEEIAGGIFFTLSDDVFENNTVECRDRRRKINSEILGI